MTIDYTYDPLNRLTAADYSNADYYHYAYDAVGNRLSQESYVGGLLSTTNYVYDDANRLSSVDGVTYTFDDNGNLLSDGVNTYVYDSANRLISVNGTETYTYNGLGDRLTQNGTQYVLDLNTDLTQVLNDGTNSYLYGNGRISQTGSVTEYFLGDALGSVRQLTDASGEVALAKSYDPYGNVISNYGNSTSPFAFTGEQQDASGLTYLRARYYSSGDGRFLSRDTWGGDYNRPLSLNRWMYVEGNPVNLVDPSGYISLHAEVVIRLAYRYSLHPHYNIPSTKNKNIRYPGLRSGKWVDLADLSLREVYEVEPYNSGAPYAKGHGVEQAINYMELLNEDIKFSQKPWTLGHRNLIDSWFTRGGYVRVETYTEQPGLVIFKATWTEKAYSTAIETCKDILWFLIFKRLFGQPPVRQPIPVY